MSVSQADYAITRLYEDESLRGELTDDEANLLLGWSEVQCQSVAAQEHSDPAFEAWTAAFKRLLVSLNRFIGKRKTMPYQEQQGLLSGIGAVAEAAGYEISQAQLEDYLRRHGEWPNDQALSELLGLMKPLPVSIAAPVPAVEPTVEPAVAETSAEPVVELPVEMTVEPVAEPTVESAVEPAAEPTVESVVEPGVEPTSEPVVEPGVEPTSEPVAEPSAEPAAEPTSEPTAEITSQEEAS
ncbi:MAG: hypothetical protein JNM70_12035 [Anaerolineae bacterium]|nr:hypothetical protein [Anaerolineae bacterium]